MEAEEPLGWSSTAALKKRALRTLDVRTLTTILALPAEIIIQRLASDGGGLDELLSDVSISEEKIFLFLQLVDKCFTPGMMASNYANLKCVVDKMLQESSVFLTSTLCMFLSSQEYRSGDRKRNTIITRSVLAVLFYTFQFFPLFARSTVHQFLSMIKDRVRFVDDAQNMKSRLNQLEKSIGEHEDVERPIRHRGMRVNVEGDPLPEGFRELPLIPRQCDLISNQHLFVRCNKEFGSFSGIEEYLDIQFRLARADYIIPIRESIETYLGVHDIGPSNDVKKGVRVYQDVHIICPVCHDKDLGYRLSFDASRFTSVNWKTSQRLKYGSLLCLSSDNFQTYLWATVIENKRSTDRLENGIVDVVFILGDENDDSSNPIVDIPREQRFVMVESPAYFEAYRHVLVALKNLNDHNFPFSKYIVDCQLSNISPPAYLRKDVAVMYDFSPLLDFDVQTTSLTQPNDFRYKSVNVMSGQNWPTADELHVDATQYRALHAAITKEFAMIQGPPGTGKTYLGVKILRMLLHNSKAWNDPSNPCPLLIVCYTNHALDQFLEGVLKFFHGALVRVGSRSSSEALKEFSLQNFRTRARTNRNIPVETFEARVRAKNDLKCFGLDIDKMAMQLEIAEREIVNENFLKEFICEKVMQGFMEFSRHSKSSCGMAKWLRCDYIVERLRHQAEYDLNSPMTNEQFLRFKANTRPKEVHEEDKSHFDFSDDDNSMDLMVWDRDSGFNRNIDWEEDDITEDSLFEDLHLVNEASEVRQLRKRQLEQESEYLRIREKNIALDVTCLCDAVNEMHLQDKTTDKPTAEGSDRVKKYLMKLLNRKKKFLQSFLRNTDKMSEDEARMVQRNCDLWKMPMMDRGRLYRYWTDMFCRKLRGELRNLEMVYCQKAKKYREILYQEDRCIMAQADILAMTTTAAARYQSVLNFIGPRVIVIEEAAEVFEAHVISTLSVHCQHLILIGDHKQLRPNPTVYDLAKKCNLDVSLFERMVHNGITFNCLNYQHRMRPEISSMMRLHELYPDLEDHPVVKGRPDVRGVRHNVFYITHSHHEEKDEDTKSCSNQHEACFLVALCNYLLKQGYSNGDITFLTPYSSQVEAIRKVIEKRQYRHMKDVRVSSVDNFQGEENEIILLSLVRSNTDNEIGFLKMNNRICVALSRAKLGMYIVANLEVLQHSSPLMEAVTTAARFQNILGGGLNLVCSAHTRLNGIDVTCESDFRMTPEGGCEIRCEVRLKCGHQCPRTCHPNQGHNDIVCPMPCRALCLTCQQRCTGDHECGFHQCCLRKVDKVIPRCGHTQLVSCGEDLMSVECQAACSRLLPCGHRCKRLCGQPCPAKCTLMVEIVKAQCGHTCSVECRMGQGAACTAPCSSHLACGHMCSGMCGWCQNGRLHLPCKNGCRKILICGHSCSANCCQCPPCKEKCANRCTHARCDNMCGNACQICVMPCGWQCDHLSCSKLCGEMCDRGVCNMPCQKTLSDCHHPCIGLCGETCPPFCWVCDREILFRFDVFERPEVGDRFVFLEDCCHAFEVSALDKWVQIMTSPNASTFHGSPPNADPDTRVVRLPECPQCKTPIRCSQRYGNQVKSVLKEFETIKSRCRGDSFKIRELASKVLRVVGRMNSVQATVVRGWNFNEIQSECQLATILYQALSVVETNKLLAQISTMKFRYPCQAHDCGEIEGEVKHFISWLLIPRIALSEQERHDSHQEKRRLTLLIQLLYCHNVIQSGVQVDSVLKNCLANCICNLRASGPVEKGTLSDGESLQADLKLVVTDAFVDIDEKEKEMVIKAISVPIGQWYACPKGHYYAIGECGRPMEQGVCPDCHSSVGGHSHQLDDSNRHAPEFDGALGPLWSEDEDRRLAEMLLLEDLEAMM